METTELLETATAPYDVFEDMSSCVGREKGNRITTRGNINQYEYENREKSNKYLPSEKKLERPASKSLKAVSGYTVEQ